MLRKKLKLSVRDNKSPENDNTEIISKENDDITSKHFPNQFWREFYDIEYKLNIELKPLQFNANITHIYNPIEYASELHCAYLKKYLDGPKYIMFVGMNPGPNGMAQTGIPFGNKQTVREWMNLDGHVDKPENLHPKRPINGLECSIEEPSGKRFWEVLKNIAGDLDTFSKQCFMHNFCPLVFYDKQGHNITPSELKGPSKTAVRDICLKYLKDQIELVNPQILIPVGSYVADCLKVLIKNDPKIGNLKIIKLMHPSPRSLNNHNWPEKAVNFFESNDLVKYLKNEI